jgi:hypothetical protein
MEWRTNDLGIAAYLTLCDHEIIDMQWRPPGNCFFVFERTPELMVDVINYTGNIAQVNPKEFLDEYGRVKREMINSRPSEMDPRRRLA